MRVLQLCRRLDRSRGIQGVAWELAREFRRRGVPVENHCLFPPAGAGDADLGQVRWHPVLAALCRAVPWRRLRLHLEVPLFTLVATRRARRAASAVVIVHNDSIAGDLFVGHSCHWAAVAAKIRSGSWRWLLQLLHLFVLLREAWVFRRHRQRFLVPVSRAVGEEYRRFHRVPAASIVPIPNGVDRERFRPAADKQALRRRLGLPATSVLLLFVGHEFDRKGLRLVLEGMARPGLRADVELVVVGGDRARPYRAIAGELGLAGRVHFTGDVDRVEDYFAAADVLLLLSDYEPFGLVGLEALASGLPVVATRVGGIPDYLRHGQNGLLIERRPAAVAAALRALLGDRDELRRLAARARPSTAEFAWPAVAERYLELCRRIAREKTA